MKLRALLIVAAGLLIAADAKEDAKKELEKLKGTWVVTSAERDGKQTDRLNGDKMTIAGEGFVVTSKDGKELVKATIKLDPSKKPKTIDLTLTEGSDKDKVVLGIYALDGDKMKICLNEPGNTTRPTEFASKEGTRLMVVELKRDKP